MERVPERVSEQPPAPAWDIALLFPAQGSWGQEDYLALPGRRLVELSHGVVEVLPVPTEVHQGMVAHLYMALQAFVAARALGKVRFAPWRLRLWPGKFREPDVLFLSAERDLLRGEQYWSGADLVIEVVSDDTRQRDLVIKRREYAAAGIDEYWTVDAYEQLVTVLRRDHESYVEHGSFTRGQKATSARLPGFTVAVSGVLDAAWVSAATLGTMRQVGMMLSMGIAMLLFAVYMGRVEITPEYYDLFLKSTRTAFIIFAGLCFAGIFASLARGRVRGEGPG